MKIHAYGLYAGMLLLSMSLMACDTAEGLNKPKAETRTMIIGGVPVHEQDYKRPNNELAWNEPSPTPH